MTQTSRLVLEIDSRDAEQKAEDVRKALGALEAAGLRVKPAMDEAGSGMDGAGTSARKASGSIDGLADSSSKSGVAARKTAETFDQASNRLLDMAKNSLQASEYIKAMSASTEKAGAAFDAASTKAASLAALAKRLREESDANVGANGRQADSSKKSAVATQEQATALANLLGRIDPVSRKLAELDKQEQELQRHRKSGTSGLDTETFKTYQATIDKNRTALGGFNSELKRTGVSAAQTQAALRQLPAQFTDIFTSLAVGQNPLMVLIQQGGQIKDSFGGVGATFDALGSKIKGFFSGGVAAAGLNALAEGAEAAGNGAEAAGEGLGSMAEGANTAADASKNAAEAANALKTATTGAGVGLGTILGGTALVAAGAALVAMFVDAEREVSAFNKALFSGTASSGQTASSLSEMAKSAALLTGRIGEAKDAVIALGGASGLSETQFRNLALAATAIGEFSGSSAGEVAKALGDLGDNATKAAQKISEQYGLITSAQYDVIKGIDDQGKKQEALDVLSATLTENAQERLRKYRESLSDVERDWNDIGKAISNAYSNIRGELFPDAAKQIEIIERILKTRKEGGITGAISNGLSQVNSFIGLGSGADDDSTEALEKKLLLLKLAEQSKRESAAIDGNAGREDQDRIKNDTQWAALVKSQLTDQKKLAADILAARRLGVEAGKSQAEIDKVVADIQAKYDKSRPKPKAYQEDAGMKALDAARQTQAVLLQQNAAIGAQGTASEKIGAQAQALIKWEQQLADIKDKKTLTADQKSLLASQDLITAQLKRNVALEKENELKKISTEQTQKLLAFQENLNSQLNLAQSGLDQKLAGAGLGDKALQRLQEQQQIQQSYQSQMDRLTYDYNKSDKTTGSTQLYNQETEALRAALGRRLAMQQGYYVAVDKAQSDWTIGASSAFQTYAEQAKDVAGQTRELFTRAFTNMEDAVVNFVRTGKLSFKDFANGVIEDLIRIQVRQAAAGFLSSAFSAFTGAGASTAGAGTAASAGSTAAGYSSQYGFSDGGFTGAGGKFEPKGVVHGGEFVIRKEVVDQPGMREYLERMNANSNGYADGGYVNPTSAAATTNVTRGATSNGSAPNITQQFSFQGTPDDSTISMVKDAAYQGAKGGYEMVMRDLKQNGPIRQLIARR